jgi:hypothetical protein
MNAKKTTLWMLCISLVAAVVNGLLAGGNVDRAVVARSAWSQIGLVAWADYTRHADLSNGRVFYPAMAIGGTLLTVLVAIIFLGGGCTPRRAGWPIVLAAVFMVICLPISFKAAPFILSLRHISDQNVSALRRAFDGSFFWGRLQGMLHVGAFFANLSSIVALCWYGTQDLPDKGSIG